MWLDFVRKLSNQSENFYIIQLDFTSFDPVRRVFGWDLRFIAFIINYTIALLFCVIYGVV